MIVIAIRKVRVGIFLQATTTFKATTRILTFFVHQSSKNDQTCLISLPAAREVEIWVLGGMMWNGAWVAQLLLHGPTMRLHVPCAALIAALLTLPCVRVCCAQSGVRSVFALANQSLRANR
jgi:hypothetical protein